ncbi:MAG: hypothetical protein HYZ26_03220 [Chloroflexi bacterium]|nr:hypothetical protein [Chloroflexota bacterium]
MPSLPIRFSIFIAAALVLAACGDQPAEEADLPQPQVQISTSTISPTTAIGAPPETGVPSPESVLDLDNLPDVPHIELPGNDWFQPTPPGQIQLASGKVQLFDFSAVW